MNPTIVSQRIKSKKALFFFTLIFIISGSLFGQRSFFVDNKVLFKCDSTTMHFDEEDSLPLYVKVYWEVKPDSIKLNGKYYYPFIFDTDNPNEMIGYIRYSKKKVFILPRDNPKNNSEQILFDFSSRNSCQLHGIFGLGGYTIHKVRKYYSSNYKEIIYVIKMDHHAYPATNLLDEIHIGIKSGLIKAHFISHYGPCCDMQCIRKTN